MSSNRMTNFTDGHQPDQFDHFQTWRETVVSGPDQASLVSPQTPRPRPPSPPAVVHVDSVAVVTIPAIIAVVHVDIDTVVIQLQAVVDVMLI